MRVISPHPSFDLIDWHRLRQALREHGSPENLLEGGNDRNCHFNVKTSVQQVPLQWVMTVVNAGDYHLRVKYDVIPSGSVWRVANELRNDLGKLIVE